MNTASMSDASSDVYNEPLHHSIRLDDIKHHAGEVVVVKFGGNAIMNETVIDSLVSDTVTLMKLGVHVVVVHGGGTAVSEAISATGKTTEKVNGLRVTDSETLEIAVKVFSEINQKLTEKFQKHGVSALSFCSQSAIPIFTEKMRPIETPSRKVDLGWVGEVVAVEAGVLESWIFTGWIPVISPMGVDNNGHFYNINADSAALAVATTLKVDKLIFLTDVPGVLKNPADKTSTIPSLNPDEAAAYIEDGTITGGMLPKIKSCVAGLKAGVQKVVILNSFEQNALLRGFLTPEEIGTLIVGAG
jgi:acetylglutamate kinase